MEYLLMRERPLVHCLRIWIADLLAGWLFSLGYSANVWDSAGNTGGKPIATTTDAGTQILKFQRDNSSKTVYTTIDLSFKWSPGKESTAAFCSIPQLPRQTPNRCQKN